MEEGTSVYHPSSFLDQDSILPLETRHPVWEERREGILG